MGGRTLAALAPLAALLAACGSSGPRVARADAAPLIRLSTRIAGEAPCAQARDVRRLQQQAVALVNAHRVPADLLEPFMSGVNALAAQAPACRPGRSAPDHATSTRARGLSAWLDGHSG